MKTDFRLSLWKLHGFVFLVLAISFFHYSFGHSQMDGYFSYDEGLFSSTNLDTLIVRKSNDFEIDGRGNNLEWEETDWHSLNKLHHGNPDYHSRFKILYSEQGIYILFQGDDKKITTEDYNDMDKIWNGDVFEAFFYPDHKKSVYLEYEVNQLGKQLLLTISKSENGVSWIPFNEYDENTYGTFNKVHVIGGTKNINEEIVSWTAEVFLSYKSMELLPMVPPVSGSVWRANFYRIDYDGGNMGKWSWSPKIEESFHELNHFGFIQFE